MKCPKCNHSLPSDSEFCQYCGTRIVNPVEACVVEKKEESAVVSVPPAFVPAQTVVIAPASVPHSGKPVKTKYCSRCGFVIDNKTKKCTGCGKQYFRGLRFTKFSVTVIILAFVIAVLSTICLLQFSNTRTLDNANQTEIDKLEIKIGKLERQVANRDATIKRLEDEIEELEFLINMLK